MTELREARRAAEKAAKELLAGTLITAVGELGVAVAQQQGAATGVDEAEQRAREHVRQAELEAQRMVAAAREQVSAAQDGYRRAHEAAVAAGWSPAALTDMGYDAPPAPKRSRSQPARQPAGQEPVDPPAASDKTARVA